MGKSYSYRNSDVGVNGLKTSITITTEDPQVIRDLLGPGVANKSSNKDNSIKAKVKEVKPKANASKALPAPKASVARKSNASKTAKVKAKKSKPKTSSVNSNSKIMTVSEFRKKLRALKPNGTQELRIGSNVICKTHNGYGVRYYKHEPDPMTDYNPWTFGFKEKWLINEYLKQGLLKE